jgi:hypothetical protein
MDSSKCFQTHRTKFKGIISVSNWQKQNIIEKLNLPSDKIFVSRNAIYPQRFINNNIEKQPYRFIYTSDPSRGLSKLIDILPFIKAKFPETTLYIFALIENIDESTLQKIETMKSYVFLNSRLSQQEIANEFLKSDIWFYPTDFKETIVYAGINADNHLISVWVNPSAQTATITESNNQITCILTIINNLQYKQIF